MDWNLVFEQGVRDAFVRRGKETNTVDFRNAVRDAREDAHQAKQGLSDADFEAWLVKYFRSL